MLGSTLFNSHDFVVLLAGVFSGMLAILLLSQPPLQRRKQYLLAGLFMLCSIHSIDTLTYWNQHLNQIVSDLSSNYFFLGWPALFLQGPALFLAMRTELGHKDAPNRRDLIHAAPAAICALILVIIYYAQPESIKQRYIHDWAFVKSNIYFATILWVQTLSLALYSIACIVCWRKRPLRNAALWLRLLVIGFIAVNLWRMSVLILSYVLSPYTIYIVGTIENYLRLGVIASLMVCWLRDITSRIPMEPENDSTKTSVLHDPPLIPKDIPQAAVPGENAAPPALRQLQKLMQEKKPYLQSNINLERLAAQMDMSPKQLSGLINKQLQQNFFEMIRNYRIEEAQRRLADENYQQQPINDIMGDCGFNSKSVFNQAFKERFGVTPGQYRKQQLGQLWPEQTKGGE